MDEAVVRLGSPRRLLTAGLFERRKGMVMFELGQRVRFTTGPLGGLGSDATVGIGDEGTVVDASELPEPLPNEEWVLVLVLRAENLRAIRLLVPVHESMVEAV